MTETIEERFYALLPQIYRNRDLRQGQPLRALLAVLEGEYQALQADIEATYDNWFVDTCDQWTLPYIADLLGIRGLDHDQHLFATQRRLVANAIGYRRRKGTLAVLEHVLRDVSGWGIRVVDCFQLLSVTQHLAHLRPSAGRTAEFRDALALSQVGGAFEHFAHTVDVRRPCSGPSSCNEHGLQPAKYHPSNLSIFVWRLAAYPLDDVFARPVSGPARQGCFTFDPAGRSLPLFNRPQPVNAILDRVKPQNLAIPLTRELLRSDLASNVAAHIDTRSLPCPAHALEGSAADENSTYYGPDRSFSISWCTAPGKPFQTVGPDNIVVADLSDWQPPPGMNEDATASSMVVVDPQLGRMRFLGAQAPAETGHVIVSATHGYSAEIGGGAYSRPEVMQALANLPDHALRLSVAEGGRGELAPVVGEDGAGPVGWQQPLRTLQAALAAWDRYCAACAASGKRPMGVILIHDNGRYGGNSQPEGRNDDDASGDLVIRLPSGAQLAIMAADGKRPSIRPFRLLRITTKPQQVAPASRGLGAAHIEPSALDRRLEFNGLLLEGKPIEIQDQHIEGFLDLAFKHCTAFECDLDIRLRPSHAPALRVEIEHSLIGPLHLPQDLSELVISDSIVDSGSQTYAIGGAQPGKPGPATTLERVTVLGVTHVGRLKLASDVIFTQPVQVEQRESGLVRRSYLPLEGSSTPRREHCQPDQALHERLPSASAGDATAEAQSVQLQNQLRPVFTATDPSHPGYAQLHTSTPPEIRHGGEAGAEMGAFHNLYQAQREANLRRALDEYLPLGRQASIHFVT